MLGARVTASLVAVALGAGLPVLAVSGCGEDEKSKPGRKLASGKRGGGKGGLDRTKPPGPGLAGAPGKLGQLPKGAQPKGVPPGGAPVGGLPPGGIPPTGAPPPSLGGPPSLPPSLPSGLPSAAPPPTPPSRPSEPLVPDRIKIKFDPSRRFEFNPRAFCRENPQVCGR